MKRTARCSTVIATVFSLMTHAASDLLVGRGSNRVLQRLQLVHDRFQPDDLVLQSKRPGRGAPYLRPVGRFQRSHVAGDPLLDLLDPQLPLGSPEALVMHVHRELAPIVGEQAVGK